MRVYIVDASQFISKYQSTRIFAELPPSRAFLPGTLYETLSPAERQKALSFLKMRDALLYSVAHAALRIVLCRETGAPDPRALVFVPNRFGKPELHGRPVRCNLSHSWPWAAIAVNTSWACGVDVEFAWQAKNWRSIASLACSPDERRDMLRYGSAEDFIRLWTVKEAVAKAAGLGMSLPFDRLDVDFRRGRVLYQERLLRATFSSSRLPDSCGWLSVALYGARPKEVDAGRVDCHRLIGPELCSEPVLFEPFESDLFSDDSYVELSPERVPPLPGNTCRAKSLGDPFS